MAEEFFRLRSSPMGSRRGPQAKDGLFADFVLLFD
jgi:hypothetical protein